MAAGQPPKVVSEIMGHASTAFTADVYQVVVEELAEAAADAIAAYIPAGRGLRRRNEHDHPLCASIVPARASYVRYIRLGKCRGGV